MIGAQALAAPASRLLGQPHAVAARQLSFLNEPPDLRGLTSSGPIDIWRARRVCDGRQWGSTVTFVFRAGQLERMVRPPDRVVRHAPGVEPWKAPRDPVLAPFAGALPFQDSLLDGLGRSGEKAIAADTLLVNCPRLVKSGAARPQRFSLGNPSDQQVLALAPFAVLLPSLNKRRREAAAAGQATFKTVVLGAALPGGRDAFIKRPGVRSYGGGAYEVFSIDMGSQPNNNVANVNEAAFVGVRNGRVEWKARDRLGVGPELCLDRNGVPGANRKGCSSTGHFTP
ncbi:hypothetical protein ABOZ73_01550 [Caulobacter sp. 73W]|uniref:Uncharacterized protein n=1 Tax=Caulobacter sp. 73W TaxID=3161137 RepID=A0AB39KTQ7_9CAUL